MKKLVKRFSLLLLVFVIQVQAQHNTHRLKRITHNKPIQETKGVQDFSEPHWKMKFYFEDATGAKDTLTIGYDSSAEQNPMLIDSQFDEGWEEIDTSEFNVYLYKDGEGSEMYPIPPPIDVNVVRKTSITSWPYPQTEFGWVHGQPPISITWDDEMLDSDKLPNEFVALDDYPRARIDLWVQTYEWMISGCIEVFEDPEPPTAILSNSPDLLYGYCTCVISNELIFDIESDNEIGDIMDIPFFILEPYDDFYWLSTENYQYTEISIYPNPAQNVLSIEMQKSTDIDFTITAVCGKTIKKGVLKKDNEISQIDIAKFSKGGYFFKTAYFTAKFIKN